MNVNTPEPDDDQHWLDLMAGRAAPDADARTRKEAAWLRAALLSYRVMAPEGAPAGADERANRLLDRARSAGVLTTTAVPETTARHKPANHWRYALAAGVAIFGVLLVARPDLARLGEQDSAGTLRGAPVQRIVAQDPVQHRQRLLQDLAATGFDAQPFERLGRIGIDIALPVPLTAAQAAALTRLGLVPPAGPSLQIEFVTLPATQP